MNESGNYPPGTEYDKNAPWNEVETPMVEFDCTISQTLSKPCKVETNNYIANIDEEDGHVYYDTIEVLWDDEYREQHLTPLDLIKKCEEFGKRLLNDITLPMRERKKIRDVIRECKDWNEDDFSVIEE